MLGLRAIVSPYLLIYGHNVVSWRTVIGSILACCVCPFTWLPSNRKWRISWCQASCCVGCLQYLVEFFNKYAYIEICTFYSKSIQTISQKTDMQHSTAKPTFLLLKIHGGWWRIGELTLWWMIHLLEQVRQHSLDSSSYTPHLNLFVHSILFLNGAIKPSTHSPHNTREWKVARHQISKFSFFFLSTRLRLRATSTRMVLTNSDYVGRICQWLPLRSLRVPILAM